MFQFSDLQQQLSLYLTEDQISKIHNSYLTAKKAHEGQLRSTGEPYITHPLSVASILADMRIDYKSIMAAILHDVIEDTSISKDDLLDTFGEEVSDLVDGVSKLAQIKFESKAEAQAENLRKMMLAMAKDIRVILIKIADRMHNMRTLQALNRDKQRRIAMETLEIYAPIANRLGMNKFRIEFEDLGFGYLYPVRYRVLKEAVLKARGNRKEIVSSLKKSFEKKFQEDNVNYISIIGREKHLYSLYKKMRTKDLSLSEIMDVYALRVIVKDESECYRVLGVVHSIYKPVHGRFKDYIAVPKANGYKSLHTTVLGPHGVPVEIQIRTEKMDQLAENGIAAHWLYKANTQSDNDAQLRAREWLKGLLEIQKNSGDSLEFIEHVKIDLYPDEVYVFTPEGDILSLPSGATAVDFAYAVHTDIGNTCIAAKIDRRLVPLSTRLSSGQTVEIINAEGAYPNPAWLSFVVLGKARSNIRHWLKMQKKAESIKLGVRLLSRALLAMSIKSEDILDKNYIELLKELSLKDKEELYTEIGLGNQMAPIIARRLVTDLKDHDFSKAPLAIKGTEGMILTYAKCCRPVPGDPIIGFLSAGRGMVIHRENCKNLIEIKKNPEKHVFVQWDKDVEGEFLVELEVDVLNKKGALARLANVFSESNANIENVRVDERDLRHNCLIFLVNIKDRKHLAKVIKRIKAIDIVTKISRAR